MEKLLIVMCLLSSTTVLAKSSDSSILTAPNLYIETPDYNDGRLNFITGWELDPANAIGMVVVPLCVVDNQPPRLHRVVSVIQKCSQFSPRVYDGNFTKRDGQTYSAILEGGYPRSEVIGLLYFAVYKDIKDVAFDWIYFNADTNHQLYSSKNSSVNLLGLIDQVIECHNSSGTSSAECKKLKIGGVSRVNEIDLSRAISDY